MESQNAKYANLQHVDDRDDSRSSTEVEDSLMGDEKQWHDVELNRPTTRTRRNRFVAAIKSTRWFIDTILLVIILALLVRDQWRQPAAEEKEVNPWQFGQDMTGVGPRCRLIIPGTMLYHDANEQSSFSEHQNVPPRYVVRTE